MVPLTWLSFTLRPDVDLTHAGGKMEKDGAHGKIILVVGICILIGVPAFKIITHLPPYIGMLLGLGIIWVVSEVLHPGQDESIKKNYTVAGALSRIDSASILFFLGILLAVSALESMETLQHFASYLQSTIENQSIIITLIGLLSAVLIMCRWLPRAWACMALNFIQPIILSGNISPIAQGQVAAY